MARSVICHHHEREPSLGLSQYGLQSEGASTTSGVQPKLLGEKNFSPSYEEWLTGTRFESVASE